MNAEKLQAIHVGENPANPTDLIDYMSLLKPVYFWGSSLK